MLVAPVLAIFSFLAMLWPIPTLEGLLGDSLWTRMATALHQRRLGPLFFPVLIYLLLPMGLFSYGTSKAKVVTPEMLVMAGLGATLLGTVVGGVCGTIAGKTRTPREFPMLSNASPLPEERAQNELPEWSPKKVPDTRIESRHRPASSSS